MLDIDDNANDQHFSIIAEGPIASLTIFCLEIMSLSAFSMIVDVKIDSIQEKSKDSRLLVAE